MPDQLNEGHESPKTGDNDTGGGDPFDDVDDLDTHVTPPVSVPTFYRADHDEDGSDRPSGNSTVVTRLAGEEHSNNPFESTHASMARYAEAARNNRMNNNNRYR
ncbi:hypothetical protein [Priestia megaterium]|uniref:hypothetical protein n=1 Tax=Priestia megaterium TaxID=1404 RepID=UPI00159C5FA5|nr:hypothetical protein [Priestia megaterium]